MPFDTATALVVVDVQNDFVDPSGSLYVVGAENIVGGVTAAVREATAAGATVVYSQDWHPPDTPHFAKDGGTWPVHCVRHTWGAELHPDLVVAGDVVRKGIDGEDGYSAFSVRDPRSGAVGTTRLDAILRAAGIERVVVVGVAGDVCVLATALDAVEHGYATVVVPDLTRSVNLQAGDEDRAFAAMQAAGVALG